ncbi:LysR family transcriptional regulator [Acinetobacter colistiniresistens]|uniref:LysR family transcriptional regulator n=1 Tax=Acinetobacter colistiniresistens TaxID=280145 RepID=UPI00211CAC72|nr:LysR family transcriptional regulator [Acinetobacter colistiniresistens]UUM29211.1 LysR family transcriptional regulator [Acinetobacter colistiniresistens]
MDIRDLKTFIYVVDHQSITIASKKLGVNQSTVTKRISNIEELVKGTLFNRKTRPLQLTSLGKKVYLKSCFILKQLESLQNFSSEGSSEVKKKIRIGITQTFIDDILDHVVYESKKLSSYYEIDIYSGWGCSLIQQVYEGELDLAALMIPSNLGLISDIAFFELGTLPFVIVTRKGEACKYHNLEMCSKRGWILHPDGCCFRESLAQLLYDRKLGFYINKEIFGIELQLQSILRGEGLGLYPKSFFDSFVLQHDDLEIVELNDFSLSLQVGVIKSQQIGVDEANAFIEIVKNHYFQ